jgi:hypothetical protein
VQDFSYLNSLINHTSAIIPDKLGEQFSRLADTIKDHTGEIDLAKKAKLLGRIFTSLALAGTVVEDIVEYLAIQSFIIQPEIQNRINALDGIHFTDEVANSAYQAVRNEINNFSINYYIEMSGIELDDLLDYAKFISKLVNVGGIPGLALWVGLDVVIDIIGDSNSFMFLTAIASLQQELAQQLRPMVNNLNANNIYYDATNKMIRLLSIQNVLDYTYYSIVYRIYEFNYASPSSWIRNGTYFVFGYYNTYSEFIAELQRILNFKLSESNWDRYLLFQPFYLADLGMCYSSGLINCSGNVLWLNEKTGEPLELNLELSLSPQKPSYQKGDQLELRVSTKDIFNNFADLNQNDVHFKINKGGTFLISSGNCYGANGNYVFTFQIDDKFSPGSYTIEVNVFSPGYRDESKTMSFDIVDSAAGHDFKIRCNPSPYNAYSPGNKVAFEIQIDNIGNFTENVTSHLTILGPNNYAFTYSENKGTLNKGGSTGLFTMYWPIPSNAVDGIYSVEAKVTGDSGDQDFSNNKISMVVDVSSSPPPPYGCYYFKWINMAY